MASRTARADAGRCVLEGPDLVEAALDAGHPLDAVYVDAGATGRPEALARRAAAAGAELVVLADGVLARVGDARSPQGLLATCPAPLAAPEATLSGGVVLVVAGLADPGNLGTAIRSADAAGCAGVICCGGVEVCNPKALRATAGSVFHLPVAVAADLGGVVATLHAAGRTCIGAVPRGGVDLWSSALPRDAAVVVGGEARGLEEDAGLLDALVTIPMPGRAESLNAAVAAAIVCFEVYRRGEQGRAAAGTSPTI